MNEKQQQLTFDKGITNVPSDAICSDNALEESIGMIYDDGEHRVIQAPVTQMTSSSAAYTLKMLYIHSFNNQKRYICIRHIPHSQDPDKLVWATKITQNNQPLLVVQNTFDEVDVSTEEKANAVNVTSVGKTLVVADTNGMHYFLWEIDDEDEPQYNNIGQIPEPDIKFWVKSLALIPDFTREETLRGWKQTWISHEGAIKIENNEPWIKDHEQFNNIIAGCYSKNILSIARSKGFCKPFFIRYAYLLYDDSYTYISNPILMFPCITRNTILDITDENVIMETGFVNLFCSADLHNIEDFSDIVKDVVVFISRGIDVYDTSVDQTLTKIISDQDTEGASVVDGIWYGAIGENNSTYIRYKFYYNGSDRYIMRLFTESGREMSLNYSTSVNRKYTIVQRSKEEIINELKATSTFYKLCSIGLKSKAEIDMASRFETHTLENLTTQEVLENDDYYSRTTLFPKFIYSYNSRLNLANIRRGFFEGFDKFMPYDNYNSNGDTYQFYVKIKTSECERWIMHQKIEAKQRQGNYFFYPDSRANRVVIYKNGNCILDEELTEHPGLNGAYYFRGLPGIDYTEEPSGVTPLIDPRNKYDNNAKEYLPNYIIQSEVNNPWVFKAEGYFVVGTGRVIAMSSITQALSEGQFGQYPLLVFTTEGIWALSVAPTGYYSSKNPMSREVCFEEKPCIVQTDGAVFFSSKKGLMVVIGNQVKCVSEQLSGMETAFTGEIQMGSFQDYLESAYIAYDYRDSLLWIFNSNYEYCWVYNIKSGTFGKYHYSCSYVVNDYPDYLMSVSTHFDSFIDRPNINSDNTNYTGLMISRPMKLENAFALKSIMQIMHAKKFKKYTVDETETSGTMTLRIFASNNLNNWAELHSLRGTPWKYYRFRYDFTNLKATDRFSGSVLITQERRTDKLR